MADWASRDEWWRVVEEAAEVEVRAYCRPPLITTPIDGSLFRPITHVVDEVTGERFAIRQALDSDVDSAV